MITKCPYCDYAKPDEPISEHLIRTVLDTGTPEDWLLWMRRLMHAQYQKYGIRSYNGVKVHIGLKHKGRLNSPTHEFNELEKATIEKYS